jgi:hypothetical protein
VGVFLNREILPTPVQSIVDLFGISTVAAELQRELREQKALGVASTRTIEDIHKLYIVSWLSMRSLVVRPVYGSRLR